MTRKTRLNSTTSIKLLSELRQKLTTKKVFYIACYAIVPLFFIIFYTFMTKTYEDLLQTHSNRSQTMPELFSEIYHYIPRLGESYQRIVMQLMTTQASFGADILVRVLAAAISAGLIYALTFFALGRRPKLQLKDTIIYLGFFVALMGFEISEVFLYRFSYVHNYALAALALVVFLLPYRLAAKSNHPLAYAAMLALGFLFGISTEIAPIAILIVLASLAAYLKLSQHLSIKTFWQRYHLQVTGVIGIFLGLVFFYLGAGVAGRTGGAYGEIYDYIPLSSFFSSPIKTAGRFLWHAWYNIRYLTFGLIFMLFILLHELIQSGKTRDYHRFVLQCSLFAFNILYIGASSLIEVHDDLYSRFLMPVYMTIFASISIFLYQNYFDFGKKAPKVFQVIGVSLAVISVIMTIDMSYSIVSYSKALRPIIAEYVDIEAETNFIRPGMASGYEMTPSPIFKFVQLTPFNWGSSQVYLKYGREPGRFCYNLPSCVIIEQ